MGLAKAGRLVFFIGIGLVAAGLLFFVVFYASGSNLPIPGVGAWNLMLALALLAVSFPVWVVGLILWLVGRSRPTAVAPVRG